MKNWNIIFHKLWITCMEPITQEPWEHNGRDDATSLKPVWVSENREFSRMLQNKVNTKKLSDRFIR